MAQAMRFDTPRLQVQSWSAIMSDSDQRRILINDLEAILTPAVLLHLPEPMQIADTASAIDDWVIARAAESEVMTVRDKADDSLMGLLILAEFSEAEALKTVHLGYLLSESTWGKGYATELISELVTWYKADGQSVQLYGGVERGNPGSARVLLKNGFGLTEELSNPATEMFGLYLPYNFDRQTLGNHARCTGGTHAGHCRLLPAIQRRTALRVGHRLWPGS